MAPVKGYLEVHGGIKMQKLASIVTPSVGFLNFAFKSDGLPYYKDSDGNEHSFDGSGTISLDNSVFVSKNGNDGTGAVGRLDLPFLTHAAAVAAASAGQTIFTYPGDYEFAASLALKDGVNFYFYGKGTVTLDTTGVLDNDPIFKDNSSTITANIYAPGWTFEARSSQQVLILTANTPSTVVMVCDKFISSGDDAPYQGKGHFNITANYAATDAGWSVLYAYGGSLTGTILEAESTDDTAGGVLYVDKCPYVNLRINKAKMTPGSGNYCVYIPDSNAGDQFFLHSELIQGGFEWPVLVSGDSTNIYIRAQRIVAESDCIAVSQAASCTVQADEIESTDATHTDGIVHGENGVINIIGAKLIRNGAATGNDVRASFAGGRVNLIGVSYDRSKVSYGVTTPKNAVKDNNMNSGYVTVAASDTPVYLRTSANFICDGTADDVEIQAALAIGNVLLFEGTYNISVSISMPANTTLKGTGEGVILNWTGSVGGNMITNSGTANISLSDFSIDGSDDAGAATYFELLGTGTDHTATFGAHISNLYLTGFKQSGLEFRTCNNLTINNIRALNAVNASGIYFDGIALRKKVGQSTGCSNFLITDCEMHNCTAGVWAQESQYGAISNNQFYGSSANVSGQLLIQLELNCHNITVDSNVVKDSAEVNIYIGDSCRDLVISNNTVDTTYGFEGIAIYDSTGIIVSGNEIMNSSLTGLAVNSPNNRVIGNYIHSNGTLTNATYHNMYIADDDCTVIGNSFRKGTNTNKPAYGLRVTSGSNRTMVEGNDFYDSGVTGDLLDQASDTRKRNNKALAGGWLDIAVGTFQLTISGSKLAGATSVSTGTLGEITVGSGLNLTSGTLKVSAYTVHEIDDTDSPYTITETSGEVIILADATNAAITINLPTAVGNTAKYHIKKIDSSANTVTTDANTTETIDGDTTKEILSQWTSFIIISNNANWFII